MMTPIGYMLMCQSKKKKYMYIIISKHPDKKMSFALSGVLMWIHFILILWAMLGFRARDVLWAG